MNCPFMTGNYMLACLAPGCVYIPSIIELDEYCKSGRHAICPFYMKRKDGPKNMPLTGTTDKEKKAA